MIRKTSNKAKIQILTAFVIGLAVFNGLIWHNLLTSNVPESVARGSNDVPEVDEGPYEALEPTAPEAIGVPVRIKIPSIAVDAAVEKVALAADGSMDVPKDPLDTGWYAIGARPGETGSAAIAGHVDWKNGATAVFKDLHKVKLGDKVAVQDDKGATVLFVVRKIRKFDAAADAMEVFSSNDGKAHLNIITCDGAWNSRTKQYNERLVVFTDRETE